ncbi:uncharacterized protein LOC142348396 isoform X1 [Convolutriloba macropyga]|uniref:uncharacterized protein LOC142348396 isoform X1 n=1 Tax=Convolutriloba macropyga TaxID=536237 RepID=UPI003F528E22
MFFFRYKMNSASCISPNSSTLLSLPEHIIKNIIRMLLNTRTNEETGNEDLNFLKCLKDILNLRATCTRLLQLVNGTRLKLPCVLNYYWTEPELNFDLQRFLDLMKRETNWKFSALKFKFGILDADSEILSVMHKNGSLFASSVEKLELEVPSSSCAIVNSLLQWLKREALKPNADVSVCIKEILLGTLDHSSIIDQLTISGLIGRQLDFSLTEFCCKKFPNLTRLETTVVSFPVSKLKLLPHLRMLSTGNLELQETDREAVPITQITELILNHAKWADTEYFSRIICQSFPHLVYLGFFNAYRMTFSDSDYLCIPDPCSTVKTYSYLLSYFRKCKLVRYFFLKDYYPAVTKKVFVQQFLSTLEIRSTILAVKFCYDDNLCLPETCTTVETYSHMLFYFKKCQSIRYFNLQDYYPALDRKIFVKQLLTTLGTRTALMSVRFCGKELTRTDFMSAVENIVEECHSLDVLSVDCCLLDTQDSLNDQTEIDLSKIVRGEKILPIDGQESEAMLKLKDLCRDKQLKLLIMGKTVLYKSTADVRLMGEINKLEDLYKWNLKRGCVQWLSLEN